jgi:hypothetical protein
VVTSYRDGDVDRPVLGGEWIFFAFSHTPGVVLVNGSLSRHHLSFPRYLRVLEEAMIGDVTLPSMSQLPLLSEDKWDHFTSLLNL